MAIRIEVEGTDRSGGDNSTRQKTLRISTRMQGMGVLNATLQSRDASWRPSRYDRVEVWEPISVVTDGAISASGTTMESADANFVDAAYPDGDVGAHVRIAGAGADGADLYTTIASVTDEGEVEVDDAASTTVTGAQVLVGYSRFRGVLATLKETRSGGTRASSREFPMTAQDLVVALQSLYPRGTYSAELLRDRMEALIADTGADTHGIVLSWPLYDLPIRDTDSANITDTDGAVIYECEANQAGSGVAATTYTGRLTLAEVFDALMVEHFLAGGTERAWKVDTLGRCRADPYTALTLPQEITSDDLYIEGLAVSRAQEPYRNRQILFYGEGLADYVAVENTAAIMALDGRVIEHVDDDEDITTQAEAEEAAATLLAANVDSAKYTGSLTVVGVEGIVPGQIGTITVAERGMSGEHLIQAIDAIYEEFGTHPWRYQLTAASGASRNLEWLDYFAGLQRSSGSNTSSSTSGTSSALSGDLLALEQLTGTGWARRTAPSAWEVDDTPSINNIIFEASEPASVASGTVALWVEGGKLHMRDADGYEVTLP